MAPIAPIPYMFCASTHFFRIIPQAPSRRYFTRQIEKIAGAKGGGKPRVSSSIGHNIIFVGASGWILTRPNMRIEVVTACIGEVAQHRPMGGVALSIILTNIGPPTTTNHWSIEAKLRNGELFQGSKTDKPVLAFAEGLSMPIFDTKGL